MTGASKILGFKYSMHHGEVSLDPNQQASYRYRLFSRAIKNADLAQIAALQPHLQKKLEETLHETIDSESTSTSGRYHLYHEFQRRLITAVGWRSVKVAPIMRDLATGMLSVYFFSESLCELTHFLNWSKKY